MGNTSQSQFTKKTTAKEIVDAFGKSNYLAGKTAIVTGGNSGIGLETVKALANAGARVILCSRSIEAGERAIDTEIKTLGRGDYIVQDTSNIVVRKLDLASLRAIKCFAEEILRHEERIDYLICNAGVVCGHLQYTEDGFEKTLGVNHIGHFYLYSLLEEKMKQQDFETRVVCVSSKLHQWGSLDYDDPHYKKGRRWTSVGSYAQSKIANILFTKEIADRGKDAHLIAFSVIPGTIQTNLTREIGADLPGFLRSISHQIISLFGIYDKSIPQGAATTLYACLAPELSQDCTRGACLEHCAIHSSGSAQAQDAYGRERKKLWEITSQEIEEALKLQVSAEEEKEEQ